MPRSVRELIADRLKKRGLYDTPGYWDMKAESYVGLARSAWPSNAYNRHLHATQMATIDALLGDVQGQRVADVGCGTGRASLHLASRGARVTGLDFAPKAVAAARVEARERGLDAEFRVSSVREAAPADLAGAFDAVLVIGCLTVACSTPAELDVGLAHVASLARPGARVLFIEPLHDVRLWARILRMGVPTFAEHAERAGLDLVDRRGLFFVPARYLLAFVDLPELVVRPVFGAGEALLARLGEPDSLSDYKALSFRKRAT